MFLAEAHWEETCQALRKAASLENVPLSSEAVCPVRIVINLVARENKADTYPEHCNERKSSLKKMREAGCCTVLTLQKKHVKSCFPTPPSLKLLLDVMVTCKSHLGV